MDIQELIKEKGEGLKKLGAIIWLLNKIETKLITCITVLLSDSSSHKIIILNRALFDETVFPNFENKRRLFLRIIDGYHKYAQQNKKKRNWPFNKTRYDEVARLLLTAQRVRNKLAHSFLSFSDDGKEASYINAKNTETMEKLTISLDNEVIKLQNIDNEFTEVMDELLRETNI